MEKQAGIKLFFVLLLSTVFVFSFSHFGAMGYEAMTTDNDRFTEGTMIGSVDVANKTKDEAQNAVIERMQIWQNGTTIEIKYKEISLPVNMEMYQFDLPGSVAAAKNGQSNPLITIMDVENLRQELTQLSSDLVVSEEDFSNLHNELLRFGNNLTMGNHKVSLQPAQESEQVISEVVMTLDAVSVQMGEWVSEMSPLMIPAESNVSLLKVIEDQELSSMPQAVMSMIGTGIYQTVLPTNFKIMERHLSQQLPAYATLGFEAKVSKTANLDFVFANPNDSEYRLELQWNHPTLTIQLIGSPFLYDYRIETTGHEEFEPKTIIQYSPQLPPAHSTVSEEGQVGQLVQVNRRTYGENGEFLSEELLSEDYYAPVERIEVHGLTPAPDNTGETLPNPDGVIPEEGTQPGGEGEINPGEEDEINSGNEDEGQTDNVENEIEPPASDDSDQFWGKPNEEEK